MVNKKRIAFCLFGQVRFAHKLKEYYDFICANEEYIVDVFIATWNDFDTSLLNINFKAKLFFSTEVMDRIAIEGNTPRMAYLISKSIQLKREAEVEGKFKYDYVVVKRVDSVVEKQSFYSLLKTINFTDRTSPSVYTIDKFRLTQEQNSMGSFPTYTISQDYMFVESSLAADLHSLMYNFFWVHRHQENLNITYREGGHWNHIYFFKYFNFDITHSNIGCFLVRPLLDHKVFEEYCTSESLYAELVKNKNAYKLKSKQEQINNENSFDFKGKII